MLDYVGCHVGGLWYGAACYADDLVWLAPARTAAVMMLESFSFNSKLILHLPPDDLMTDVVDWIQTHLLN